MLIELQKEEEHRQKYVLATKLAQFLKEAGADAETIAKETGLSAEEVERLTVYRSPKKN